MAQPEHPVLEGADRSAPHAVELAATVARYEARIRELEAEVTALKVRREPPPKAAALRAALNSPDAVAARERRLRELAAGLSRVLAALDAAWDAIASRLARPLVFALVALLLQLPIVLNLGFFNHDELQWLAFADQPTLGDVPWNGWFDVTPFQYRPLTFNLWLLLAHAFGYHPIAMHLVRVLFGLAAALLLRASLIAFGATPRRASLAGLMFVLLPETVYTHGWIGTYADTLCLGFGLGAMLAVLRTARSPTALQLAATLLAVGAATELALLAKESAIVLPALLLLPLCIRRDRVVPLAAAVSGAVVAIYLALRLHTILYTPHDGDAYAWTLANIPARLGEYAVFPWLTQRFEPANAFVDGHLKLGIALLAVFVAAVASGGWRGFALLVVGWCAALGPILILGFSASHYAYLAVAFVCGWLALRWHTLGQPGRAALALLAVVVAAHGVGVAREMRNIGRVQHHLYQDLSKLLADGATTPFAIKSERLKEDFIVRRMLHEIPSYRRLPIGERVVAIPFDDDTRRPDYLMHGDGHLRPAPQAPR